jgi:hypothetical protein
MTSQMMSIRTNSARLRRVGSTQSRVLDQDIQGYDLPMQETRGIYPLCARGEHGSSLRRAGSICFFALLDHAGVRLQPKKAAVWTSGVFFQHASQMDARLPDSGGVPGYTYLDINVVCFGRIDEWHVELHKSSAANDICTIISLV